MERLVQDIADMSSFTPGDVKGVVALLEDRISYYLSEGHHVQLGDIGYFSASLQARPVMDPKEIHSQTIFFGKVHLRVSPDFRKRCAGYVERAKYGFRKSAELSGAERYRRLLAFLETHPFITRHDYSGITGLLKNKALDDLNLLVEKGVGTGFSTSAHTLLYTIYLLDIQWSIIMGVGCRKQRLKNVVTYQRVSICVLPPRYWFW